MTVFIQIPFDTRQTAEEVIEKINSESELFEMLYKHIVDEDMIK